MGRAIYYCVQCSKRVSDADLETGKAFRIGERILCVTCAPETARKTQTSKRVPAVNRPRNSGTSVAMKSVTAPPATPPAPPSPPGNRKVLLFAGGGGAVILVLVVVLVLAFRGSPAPAAPPMDDSAGKPPPDAPAGKAPAIDPREAAARAELDKARAFAKSNPEDLAGQQREFTDLVWKWDGTEAAREAARDSAAVKAVIMEKVAAWMAEANAQIQDLVAAKQYVAAERKMQEFKAARDLAEWKLAAEKRASELLMLGKRQAEAEASSGEKPVPAPDVKPAAKAPSEAAKAYQAKFEAAAARAAARDFGGAILELEGSAASIKEADVKAELEDDVALLKRSAAVVKESIDWLRQRPRGSGISVSHRDGSGGVKPLSGVVLQIDAERVEIRGARTSVLVEWADVTAATFAEIAQRGKFDPRTLAALCALEGETETAKVFQAELPAKWWAWAEGARAKIPRPEPVEKSARELYASAERGWRSMDTRAAAIDQYRALRTEYTSTALVKSYTERIFRRSEAGKEYYFAPADFKIDGTIRPAKNGRLESVKDTGGVETLENIAEVEFAVLPGSVYRCWLQVGACCEETFAFYFQGTELTDLDKNKKKVSCDPGSGYAVLVKHSIRNLKKTHDDHKPKGAKVHPKTAARWEWVEIALPKYAAAGGKKLRFMTDQAGFSIGGAVVSSSRKAAPVEAELKDLEKLRTLDDPPLAMDPDLVAWWTFDEATGDAVDQTGRGHTAKRPAGATSVEGKIGGALQFPGGAAGAQAADAEDLRIVADLTMSIWVRKTAEVADWVCIFGKGTSPERNYGIWLEATSKRWMYQQYGGGDLNVYGTKLVEVGQWTHLAVTIEQDTVRVYTNGAPDGQGRRPGKPPVNNGPLGLGQALHHTGLNGAVDDVRLYRRALPEAEIRALYESGK